MLTPEYLQQITEKAEDMTAKLREDIVDIMVKRYIARMKRGEDYEIISADRMLAETLQAAGMVYSDVVKIVREYSGESDRVVREMFRDAGLKAVRYESKEYEKVGLSDDGSNMSPAIKRIINRNYKSTNGTLQNITGTLATETQKTFINVCSQSLFELQTGAKSLSGAYLDAIKKIAKEGGYIEYDSGRRDTVETAVLRALRTGLTQTGAEITIDRAKELGYDLVLVSAHIGARVNPHDKIANHAGWQGQVYSLSGATKGYEKLEDATGYPSNPLGLCGYNCRHNITIFIEGISINPYRDKKGNLILDSEENKEKYEREQKARRMECEIRKSKIKKQALTTAYERTDGEEREEIGKELRQIKKRLGQQNAKYREYMDEHGMKPQDYRIKVAIRDIENKNITNNSKNDSMSALNKAKAKRELKYIGKLDKKIYKCITDDIVTDDVIITENQIEHIKIRHPNDYERFSTYFSEIIKKPDFIIETKKPNTALILKEIEKENEVFKTVLRLVTSKDDSSYKNSIITFMKIDPKEWNRLLRNKKILYKRE